MPERASLQRCMTATRGATQCCCWVRVHFIVSVLYPCTKTNDKWKVSDQVVPMFDEKIEEAQRLFEGMQHHIELVEEAAKRIVAGDGFWAEDEDPVTAWAANASETTRKAPTLQPTTSKQSASGGGSAAASSAANIDVNSAKADLEKISIPLRLMDGDRIADAAVLGRPRFQSTLTSLITGRNFL